MTGLWRVLALVVAVAASGGVRAQAAPDAGKLHVLDGYRVSLYARGLGKARLMQLTPAGDILLSSPNEQVLRILPDKDGDGIADGVPLGRDGTEGLVSFTPCFFMQAVHAATGSVVAASAAPDDTNRPTDATRPARRVRTALTRRSRVTDVMGSGPACENGPVCAVPTL